MRGFSEEERAFRSGQVDKELHSAFGFTAEANLAGDSGPWPMSFAVTELGDEPRTPSRLSSGGP